MIRIWLSFISFFSGFLVTPTAHNALGPTKSLTVEAWRLNGDCSYINVTPVFEPGQEVGYTQTVIDYCYFNKAHSSMTSKVKLTFNGDTYVKSMYFRQVGTQYMFVQVYIPGWWWTGTTVPRNSVPYPAPIQ